MLIKEGKSNLRYIFIVVVLAAIVGGVGLYSQLSQKEIQRENGKKTQEESSEKAIEVVGVSEFIEVKLSSDRKTIFITKKGDSKENLTIVQLRDLIHEDFLKEFYFRKDSILLEIQDVNLDEEKVIITALLKINSWGDFGKVRWEIPVEGMELRVALSEDEKEIFRKLWKTRRIGNSLGCGLPETKKPKEVECFGFVRDYLVENKSLPQEIVMVDEKLRDFLKEKLNLPSYEKLPMYRGILKNQSNEKGVITFYGKSDEDQVIIVTETSSGEWKLSIVPFRFIDAGEERIRSIQEIVKGEAPFFLARDVSRVGTCVPTGEGQSLYRLKGDQYRPSQFTRIWGIQTWADDGLSLFTTDLRFEDIDDDGNLEIIQEGTKESCSKQSGDSSIAFTCKECEGEEIIQQISNIFTWDAREETFVEK